MGDVLYEALDYTRTLHTLSNVCIMALVGGLSTAATLTETGSGGRGDSVVSMHA